MKVIIAGSRTFNNYALAEKTIQESGLEITEVVSGGSSGADRLGERWAAKHGIPVKLFLPNWSLYDRRAGLVRNLDMAQYVGPDGALIAWHVSDSPGTRHLIGVAREVGMRTIVKVSDGPGSPNA